MGVKDALGKLCSPSQVKDILGDLANRDPVESVEPGVARAFVEAAVEYARSIGIMPHADYRKVAPIFGDIEPLPLPDKYHFGRQGKPAYIAGPYDSETRQLLIVNTLVRTVGQGNFDYIMTGQVFADRETSASEIDGLEFEGRGLEDDEFEGGDDTIDGHVIRRVDRS